MKVDVEEISPIERKLVIEVEPEQVREELDRAYGQLSRQVKIPGFRPGHVPRRILEQRFKASVESDVTQHVVEHAYLKAIDEQKVPAVGSPQINPGKLAADAPFRFEARVEVKPKLEPKDYDGLALKKREVQVEEKEIEERIEQMRQRFARLEPVEGRTTAGRDDYAQVDYDATVEGKTFPGSKGENITVEVKPGEVVEGNVAALEGLQVGETKELDYAFPPDYPTEEVKGKVAHFVFTLKGLKRQVTPELNDEFAKEIGGGETLAALREKVKKDLEASKRVDAEREEREELIAALVGKNPFEPPKAMVERAVDMMLEGALRSVMRGGVDPRQLNLDFGKLREEMRERAHKEVQGTLLFEAIAEKEKIAPTDEEMDQKIQALAEEYGQPVHQVRKQFKSAEQREGLRLRLREEKTVEFLRSRAKYS